MTEAHRGVASNITLARALARWENEGGSRSGSSDVVGAIPSRGKQDDYERESPIHGQPRDRAQGLAIDEARQSSRVGEIDAQDCDWQGRESQGQMPIKYRR